ncbi:LysR family transcriptional regulator [Fodinicola feengrottensis]|uniref:LysR substrate-binding domain-containing protein n=1 Tax=Fodinicola feengrottensis TaxID=435914 RepID=A0ABN2HU14_9ACTN|nr:LysR family transcriptional regulator [Fodinicola feengrottensis]
MELRQLEYLVAVVEEANFTRAAARLHVAQPGVSAQIKQLERELGEPLLDRSGRQVRPTAVGAAVLPYARAALAAVAGVRLAVDELTGLVRGRVTVGTVAPLVAPVLDLPGLLAGFYRQHPDVEISLSEANAVQLIDELRTGQIDLAFIAMGDATPPGLAAHDVVDEEIVAAVRHGDPLAGRASVPLAGLRDRALICLPRGTGVRTIIEEACATAGFRPHVAFEASIPPVLAQLAAHGLGVALLPASAAVSRPDELHTLKVTRPTMRGRIVLAWTADGPTSPAARALLAYARSYLPAPAEVSASSGSS